MRRSFRTLLFFICLLLITGPLPAAACSLPGDSIRLRCTLKQNYFNQTFCFAGDCSTHFDEKSSDLVSDYLPIHSASTDYSGLFIYPQGTQHVAELLVVLEAICTHDLAAIHATLLPLLEARITQGPQAFRSGDFTIRPFDARDLPPLQQRHNNYLSCVYPEFQQAGEWLIIHEKSRPYCQWSWRPGFPCQSFDISLIKWLWFLARPSEWAAVPYLIVSLSLLGLLLWGIRLRIRRWGWRLLLPSLSGSLVSIISAIGLTIFLGAVNFWLALLVLYLLVGNLRLRRKHHAQKSMAP